MGVIRDYKHVLGRKVRLGCKIAIHRSSDTVTSSSSPGATYEVENGCSLQPRLIVAGAYHSPCHEVTGVNEPHTNPTRSIEPVIDFTLATSEPVCCLQCRTAGATRTSQVNALCP